MSTLITNLSTVPVVSPDEQAQMDWEKDLEPFIDTSGGFSPTASIPNIITMLEKAKLWSQRETAAAVMSNTDATIMRKLLENDFLPILTGWLKQAIELVSPSSSSASAVSLNPVVINTLEFLFSILKALPTDDLQRIAASKIGIQVKEIHKNEQLFIHQPEIRKNATIVFHQWTAANANKNTKNTNKSDSSSSSTSTKTDSKDKKDELVNHSNVPTHIINIQRAQEAMKSLTSLTSGSAKPSATIGLPSLATSRSVSSSSSATAGIDSITIPPLAPLAIPSLSGTKSSSSASSVTSTTSSSTLPPSSKRSTLDRTDGSDSEDDNDTSGKRKKHKKDSKDKDSKSDKRKDRDDKDSGKKDKDSSKRSRKETDTKNNDIPLPNLPALPLSSISSISSSNSTVSSLGITALSSVSHQTSSAPLPTVSSFDAHSDSFLSPASITSIGHADDTEDYFAAGQQLLSTLDPNDLLWGIPDEEEYETGFVVIPQQNDTTDEPGMIDEEIGQLVRVRGLGIPEQYGIQPRGILLNKVMGRVGGMTLQYVETENELLVENGDGSSNAMEVEDVPVLSTVESTASSTTENVSMKVDNEGTGSVVVAISEKGSSVSSSSTAIPVNDSTAVTAQPPVKKKLKRGIRWMDENIPVIDEAVTRHKVKPDELINGTLVAVKYFRKELPVSPELAAALAATTAAKALAMANSSSNSSSTVLVSETNKDAMETDTATSDTTGTTGTNGEEDSPSISFEEAKKREKLSEHENIRARLAAARAPGTARGPPPWLITSTFPMQTVENCAKVAKWAARPNFVLANPTVSHGSDGSASSTTATTGSTHTVPVLPPLLDVKSKLPRFINSNKIELEIAAAVAASHSKTTSTSLVRIRPYIIASQEATKVEMECSLRAKVSYPAPNLVPSNPVQPLPEPVPAFTTPNRQFDPVPHNAAAVVAPTMVTGPNGNSTKNNGSSSNGTNGSVPTTPTAANMLRPLTPPPGTMLPPSSVPTMVPTTGGSLAASLLNRYSAPPVTAPVNTVANTVGTSGGGGLLSNLSGLQSLLSKVSSLANPVPGTAPVLPPSSSSSSSASMTGTGSVPTTNTYPPPSYSFPPIPTNPLLPPNLLNSYPRGPVYPPPIPQGMPPPPPQMIPPMNMLPPRGFVPPPPPGMYNPNVPPYMNGIPPPPVAPPHHPSRFGPPTVPPPQMYNPNVPPNLPPPPPTANPPPSSSVSAANAVRLSGYTMEQLVAMNVGKKGPQCSFFTSSGGCRNGLKCPFIHDPNYVAPMEAFQRISAPGKPILPPTGIPLVASTGSSTPSTTMNGGGGAWGQQQPRSGPY